MTEIEAIKERHSVRNYTDRKIEQEKQELLRKKIEELNKKGNLHMQFLEDAGATYNRFVSKAMGLGSAPSVIACVGADAADLEERVGYYGEQLVLYAQQIGLNTCWTGIFSRKNIPVAVPEGESLVIAIAIGYGETPGKKRKSKRADEVTAKGSDRPEWFDYGVEMALLAPTAINQQKFEIAYKNGEVTFEDKGGMFSKVDLGIVKYHFEAGAAAAKREKARRRLLERYEFREVRPEEAEEVAEVEQICFPPKEACAPIHMKERVAAAPELFLVAVDRESGKIAGFLNGLATDETVFRDEFFTDAGLHKPDGENVMLLGLDVLPEHRNQGLAREIVERYQQKERDRNRKQLILTCLEAKVEMYEKMGFEDIGIANSNWGGEVWHEMRCKE